MPEEDNLPTGRANQLKEKELPILVTVCSGGGCKIIFGVRLEII